MSYEFWFKSLKCLAIFLCFTVVKSTSNSKELKINNNDIYSYPNNRNVENTAVFISDCFYNLDRYELLEGDNYTRKEEIQSNQEIIINFKADLSVALNNAMDKIKFYDRVQKNLRHKFTGDEKKLIINIRYKLEMMNLRADYFGGTIANSKMHQEIREVFFFLF